MNRFFTPIVIILITLTPLFFLPITPEFYDFNKQALLFVGIITLSLLWLISFIQTREVKLRFGSFDRFVALMPAVALASVFFVSPNKIEALALPGGAGILVLFALWYYLVFNLIDIRRMTDFIMAFLAAGAILSVIATLQFLNIGLPQAFPQVLWLIQKTWNPTGSPLTLALFLAAITPLAITQTIGIYIKYKAKNNTVFPLFIVYIVLSVAIGIGLFVTTTQLLTNARPLLLSVSASWSIAADNLKEIRGALLGSGPLNYLSAFTTGRPLSYNSLPSWNIRFAVASNWYLHILTEIGVLSLLAYGLIIFKFIKNTSPLLTNPQTVVETHRYQVLGIIFSIAVIFISQLFLPGYFLQNFTLFTLLAFLSVLLPHHEYTEKSRFLPYTIGFILLVLLVIASFGAYRVYKAEYLIKQSFDAALNNKAVDTYNLQIQALDSNPYIDKYHIIYSQTNMALANSIAQKPNLTDQDRSNITQLIMQAIREARSAVAVNPRNVINWENWSQIYRALIPLANGADAWSVATLQQAIALDPLNPILRINLGGVYYGAGNYDLAVQHFSSAVNLKSDWANAHYNLANALREKKDYTTAAREMEITLAFLPESSPDRAKAQTELEEIKKNIPSSQAPQTPPPTTELSKPGKPTPVISPPLVLPTGAAPEVTPAATGSAKQKDSQ